VPPAPRYHAVTTELHSTGEALSVTLACRSGCILRWLEVLQHWPPGSREWCGAHIPVGEVPSHGQITVCAPCQVAGQISAGIILFREIDNLTSCLRQLPCCRTASPDRART